MSTFWLVMMIVFCAPLALLLGGLLCRLVILAVALPCLAVGLGLALLFGVAGRGLQDKATEMSNKACKLQCEAKDLYFKQP